MWQTIRRRLIGSDDESGHRPRRANLEFKLPNPYGGPAWVQATLTLSSTPATRGDTVRIRAHVDSCLRMPQTAGDRDALAHDAASDAGPARQGRDLAAALARRGLARMPAGLLRRLGEQRRQGWLDMQISTSPLDAGAAALMPAALRERYGERLPGLVPGAPRIGVWSGPAGGERGGLARLAMLQFDDSDMEAGGRGPRAERFSLNLTIGELIEPAGAAGDKPAA